jgi:ribosomal-protein-alanine N-acetyltransferase
MQQAISEIIEYGFKIMDLKTIEACTVSQNLASIRILEKNGFVINEEAYGVMTEEERKAGSIVYTLQAIE